MDALNIAVRPQQRFAWAQAHQRSSRDRKRGSFSLASTFTAIVDAHTAPAYIFDDLHKVNGFAQVKGLHAAVNFVSLKLCCLVHHDATRRAAGMTPTIEVNGARHDPEHLRARQEWVLALDFDLMRIVCDKLQAGALGVKHLTAARDKAWTFGFHRTDGV